MILKNSLLLFILLGTITLYGCTKNKDASSDDLFVILFVQVGLEEDKLIKGQLEFSNSNENDVESFLMNFPVKVTGYDNKLASKKRYRYIKSRYGDYFILFRLANDKNPIDKRLYSIAFSVTMPNKEVADNETKTYKMLTKLYGKYSKKRTSKRKNSINSYEWELPELIIWYRSFYNPLTKKTIITTQYRDKKFHDSHNKAYY